MEFCRPKIAVIGAGHTGSTTALMLAQRELGDIVLLDVPEHENPAKGKALDIGQSASLQRFGVRIKGTSNYEEIYNAHIVVVTAGRARKPGMSRDDLVAMNADIIAKIAQEIAKYAPESYVLMLSNPVDAMTYVSFKVTQFPRNRVIGQSGVLDTARFNMFVASELNISVKDVSGFVLGGHGDDMVPLIRYSYAGGIPLTSLIPEGRLQEIVKRTRKGGGEIVGLLGNGSAYYAPAASLVQMVEAIIRDERRIFPAIAYLNGEYGLTDLCMGVPVVLGGRGLESIIELPLTGEEKEALNTSADSVKKTTRILKEHMRV